MSLPEPMTPPESDLRGMPYMPLDVTRLFDSDFYVYSSGDEFKAAVSLWGKAFLQVPAGSLPDDDRVLAHLSGAGTKWKRVKGMALRGFVKCMDGRLYHPTVAEKVADAWKARLDQRARTEAARAAKLAKQAQSQSANNAPVSPVTTPVTTSVTETVTGSKGREGKGREDKKEHTPPPEISPERAARDARIRAVCGVLGLPLEPKNWPTHWSGLGNKLETWQAGGADFQAHVLAACREFSAGGFTATKGPAYLGAIVQRLQRETKPALPSSSSTDPRAPESDAKALQRLRLHAAGEWHEAAWGPPPGQPGCLIPAHILERKDAA